MGMRLILLLLSAALAAGCAHRKASPLPPHETVILRSDGAQVFAYLFKTKAPKGLILLFHQAGSSAQEYSPIVPKLNALGWDCLAVDLRSGGDMYGQNRTFEALGRSAGYMDAYKDMVSAADYARKLGYKQIVAWGSSYSASLAAKLAVDRPFISKVLAFSPGEYMDDPTIVRRWFSQVKVPVLAVWADGEEASVRALLEGTKAEVVGDGAYAHGSSALRPDKAKAPLDPLWKQVEAFLAER